MELLLFSALGQQNGQQSTDPAKSNEQQKSLNDKISYTSSLLNNSSSSPMQSTRDLQRADAVRDNVRDSVRENLRENLRASESARENRGNVRELVREKDLNHLSKQATLAALVASMGQFSNQPNQINQVNQMNSINQQSASQLANNPTPANQLGNHFANFHQQNLSAGLSNQLSNSAAHMNSPNNPQAGGQFIHNQLISNQYSGGQLSGGNHHSGSHHSGNHQAGNQFSGNQLSDAHLLNNQQLHNSLTFDNVKNLLLNQRKNDLPQENHNIFSGGFQSLLTSLNLSVNSTQNETGFHSSSSTANTIASPNWRPIRTNAQNIITSAKQSGPASWIDRSKLGKVAAQSMYIFEKMNSFRWFW